MDGGREGAGQATHIIENHTHTVAFTQNLESAAPCSWSLITFLLTLMLKLSLRE